MTQQSNRKGFFGISPVEIGLWAAGFVVTLIVSIVWDLVLLEPIQAAGGDKGQNFNKYFLTAVMFGLAAAFAFLSNLLTARQASETPVRRPVARFMVRFGFALQFLSVALLPLGMYYATNPTRSVPVGFAYFTAAFAGLFIAGFAGNSLAPARS